MLIHYLRRQQMPRSIQARSIRALAVTLPDSFNANTESLVNDTQILSVRDFRVVVVVPGLLVVVLCGSSQWSPLSRLSPLFMVDLVMPRFDSIEISSVVQFRRQAMISFLHCNLGKPSSHSVLMSEIVPERRFQQPKKQSSVTFYCGFMAQTTG